MKCLGAHRTHNIGIQMHFFAFESETEFIQQYMFPHFLLLYSNCAPQVASHWAWGIYIVDQDYLLQRSCAHIMLMEIFSLDIEWGAEWKIDVSSILQLWTGTKYYLGVESCSKALMVEYVRAYLATSLSYATVVCSNLWPQRISEGRYDVLT